MENQHPNPNNDLPESSLLREATQDPEQNGQEHNSLFRAPNEPSTSIQQERQNMQQEETLPVEMIGAAPRNVSYTVTRSLGSGSFGLVQLVTVAGKQLAMKTIKHTRDMKAASIAQEFNIHFGVSEKGGHPNVVRMICQMLGARKTMFFMEYVSEGTLLGQINKGVDIDMARNYYKHMLNGLEYLHNNSVVHLDIKPANLLINDRSVIKICDFGIAQFFMSKNGEKQLVQAGHGTPAYSAPEVFTVRQVEGPPCDIWSAGVTLLAMFAGNKPWKKAEQQDSAYVRWMNIIKSRNSYRQMDNNLLTLLRAVLTEDVSERATLDDCKKHAWLVEKSKDVERNRVEEADHRIIAPEVIQLSSDSEPDDPKPDEANVNKRNVDDLEEADGNKRMRKHE